MIKKITFVFYVVLIVVMAAATIIEHLNSTPFVSQYIYGAWWFSLLWALLVAVGVVYIAKSHEMESFVTSFVDDSHPCWSLFNAYNGL